MNATDQFAKTVADFLAFAEAPAGVPETDLIYAIRHLKALLAGIEPLFDIPNETEPDAPDCPEELEKKIGNRFSHLPFQYYREIFDPLPLDDKEEPVVGWITDDLVGIFSDLWGGHQLYINGHIGAACWEWTYLYGFHWAQHATSALYALDSYRRDNFLFQIESA